MHTRPPHLTTPLLAALLTTAATTLAPAQSPKHDPAADAFHSSAAYRELLANSDGGWIFDWNVATGTPRALYGRGLPIADWTHNSLDEARRHALRVLQDRGDLLGLGRSEFRESIGAKMGRTWSFVFDQYYQGLPCIGGRADVRVSMAGRIAMLGSTAWPIPNDFATVPTLTPETATVVARQALVEADDVPADAQHSHGATRLVIWGDVHATTPQQPVLAWEVAVQALGDGGRGRIGRFYIDAHTGTVLTYTNDKHECGFGCAHPSNPTANANGPTNPTNPANPTGPATGPTNALPIPTGITVYGATRTSTNALGPVTVVPQAGLKVDVAGYGTYTTDANGVFTVDLTGPAVMSVTQMRGEHYAFITGSDAPSSAFQLIAGVHGSAQIGSPSPSSTQLAHFNAAWWTDQTNRFCRSILGDSPQLDLMDGISMSVNVNLTCNAYYSGNALTFYAAGGGCVNMAESTVVAHEWGHGLDDRYGGISGTNGLSEGWADIVALYLTNQPVIGENIRGPGSFVRTALNTRQFPSGTGTHQQGETWMGFAWKLRDRLTTTRGATTAVAVSNEIVLGTIVANAQDQTAALLEVWLADDNDGDLTNGTPHAAELIYAADQHNLPDPAPAGLANDLCSFPFALNNGLNGPYTNVGATVSGPFQCVNAGADVWFSYIVGSSGTLDVSTCGVAGFDTVLEIYRGDCGTMQLLGCIDDSCLLQSQLQIAVQPGMHLIRVGGYNGATGTFSLQVNGPQGSIGTATAFGTDCGTQRRTCYEFFAAGAFDLANRAFRMTRSGQSYVVGDGGAWIPPGGASYALPLGDEDVFTVTLPQAFPYPGGSTTSFEVCSNGWVAVASGNPVEPVPDPQEWQNSPVTRWGVHHDFHPAAPGSPMVRFEQVGSTAVITWNGVHTYNTTVPNYLQLQFDCSTGNVTFAFQAMPAPDPTLCGYAAGNETFTTGAVAITTHDYSAELAATFRTGAFTLDPPTLASNLPRLGRQLTLTSTFSPSVTLGVQLLGLSGLNPGLPLDGYGLPGCRQLTSAEVSILLVPAASVATYGMMIPNDPAFAGLPLACQTVSLPPGNDLAQMGFSRGQQLVVGF